MQVCVRTLSGNPHYFDVDSTTTASQLKYMVSTATGMDPSKLTLVFRQKDLEDDLVISTLDLPDQSFIIAGYKITKVEQEVKSEVEPKGPQKPTDIYGTPIPINLESLIDFIVGLKYTREQAIYALQFTKYDLRNATNLLIYGQGFGNPNEKGSDVTILTDNPMRTIYEPERKRETPKFTVQEELAIDRLLAKHGNRDAVVRVFLACDRDELTTDACLQPIV